MAAKNDVTINLPQFSDLEPEKPHLSDSQNQTFPITNKVDKFLHQNAPFLKLIYMSSIRYQCCLFCNFTQISYPFSAQILKMR